MYLSRKLANRLLPFSTLLKYQKAHRRIFRSRVSSLSNEIKKYYNPQADLTIIFPPSLDWSEQLYQRPQQMATALAKQGAHIFYFQHPEHWDSEAFHEIQPGLVLCSTPVEVFWELPVINLYSYAMTWNCRLAVAPNIQSIIYDVVDDLSVFPGSKKQLAKDHAQLTRQAHLLLATSEHLLKDLQASRSDALLCPNGVNYEHFVQARHPYLTPPEDLQALLADHRPLAGYIGALARWFDYPLLEATANARPDWHFILIGPDHDRTLPESCLRLPNVHWLGAKPYQILPAYLRYFDATLIPFQLNPITHATSPIKLYEYMAAGKPVISTPIHEATHMPGVLIAQNASHMASLLDEAQKLSRDEAYLSQSDDLARRNTWESRAKQIIDALATSPVS